MRVLLLNLYFPPDTSATAKMAEAVVNTIREVHEVTIVCGRPSYEPTERRAWRLWQTEYLPESAGKRNVRIIRVGSTDYARGRMSRRLLNYLSYLAVSVPRAMFIDCDLILAMTDPPFEGIVGAFVAQVKRKPYVYNIRDLYPEMAVSGSIVRAGLLPHFWEALHQWALRRAARVIVLGNDMRERIVSKGIPRARVEVVRDGTAISDVSSQPSIDAAVVHKIRNGFHFVLVHAGNLGFYGAWQTLIDAMRRLDRGIGLIFVGDGAQREHLRSAAARCDNVRFLPFFPAGKIPSVLAAADVHVVTIKRGLEGVIVPSKLYGILEAGKPILAVAPQDSDVAALGKEQGFAIAADPDDASSVAHAIEQLYARREALSEMGAAARRAAHCYGRVSELQKFVRVLEEAHRG